MAETKKKTNTTKKKPEPASKKTSPTKTKTTKSSKETSKTKSSSAKTATTKAKVTSTTSNKTLKKPTASTTSTTKSKVSTKKVDKATKTKTPAKEISEAKKASKSTSSTKLPLEVGEYIFYPNEGLGHIIGTEKIELEGEVIPYYVIKFAAQKMINRVPVKNIKKVGIRKIVSKNMAKNALKLFEDDIKKSDMSWKDRLVMYQEINTRGNIMEMSEMLSVLFARKQQKTSLSFQERQVFDYTLEAISDEIGIVLGRTGKEIQKEIIEKLTQSFSRNSEDTK